MLEEYLSQNEGKTLEFKENTRSLSGIIKTVVSFANTSDGVLIIGIRDQTKEISSLLEFLLIILANVSLLLVALYYLEAIVLIYFLMP